MWRYIYSRTIARRTWHCAERRHRTFVGKWLTLNKTKCILNQTVVDFLGFVFDKSGVRCHPKWIVKKLLRNCNHHKMQLTLYRFYPWCNRVRDLFESFHQFLNRYANWREVISSGSEMLNNNVHLICWRIDYVKILWIITSTRPATLRWSAMDRLLVSQQRYFRQTITKKWY